MTEPDTGHRTPDTGHRAPALRAPIPDASTTAAVPLTYLLPEAGTGHRTPDTTTRAVPYVERDASRPDQRDVPLDVQPDTYRNRTPDTGTSGTPSRTPDTGTSGTPGGTPAEASGGPSRWTVPHLVAAYRSARDTRKQDERDTLAARQVARDTAARQADATQNALAREGVKGRRRAGAIATTSEADRIAPIPDIMVKAGVWMDRAVGSIVPTASLVVSATATIQVGQDEPLKMGWLAIAFTLGLEGSVWYLNRLREAFKLEGDSTLSLNVAIGGIIMLIFGLIGGHAIWNNAGRQALNIHVPGVEADVPLSEVMPAIAIAIMSAIGAYVWAKKALFKHRAKLRAMGQIDRRAPKFAFGRWIFAPRETFCSLRHAFRYGITEAQLAVTDWRVWKATGKPAIWPVPAGFRYLDGRLTEMTLIELRDAVERDTLIAEIVERDTAATGQPDTRPSTTGRAATGRPALTNGTPDTRNGTAPAPINGTPDGTPTGHPEALNGTSRTGQHRTPDTHAGALGNGTAPNVNGTHAVPASRTPDTSGTPDGDGLAIDADILRLGGYIMIVVEEIADWATNPKAISMRKVRDAIDQHRIRNGEGRFRSNDIAGEIAPVMRRLAQKPELLDLIRPELGTD